MQFAIATDQLCYSYGRHQVIHELSLNVPEGAIYGFLGPNGAGKSTTMALISGNLVDAAHSIDLFGKPKHEQIPQVFGRIGSLVESPSLYLHLSGVDNMRYIAHIKQAPSSQIDELLKIVRLDKDAHRKAHKYSLGMKQRLAIAMALLKEPKLLLLDEPVNGLDPSGIKEVRELLVQLNQERGMTIFISSHLLDEVEKMCTHIGMISKGRLTFEGTMQELYQMQQGCQVILTLNQPEDWVAAPWLQAMQVQLLDSKRIKVSLTDRESVPAFVQKCVEAGIQLYEVHIDQDLESRFFQLTHQLS